MKAWSYAYLPTAVPIFQAVISSCGYGLSRSTGDLVFIFFLARKQRGRAPRDFVIDEVLFFAGTEAGDLRLEAVHLDIDGGDERRNVRWDYRAVLFRALCERELSDGWFLPKFQGDPSLLVSSLHYLHSLYPFSMRLKLSPACY